VPTLNIDFAVVCLFIILNSFNLRIGQSIQFGFLALKSLPILFAIGAGCWLWVTQGSDLTSQKVTLNGIIASMPFVLYAFTGFEACCSLSRTIVDPERNGPRALLISYGLGVSIVILYQLMFYGGLSTDLAQLPSYSVAFPALLCKVVTGCTFLFTLLFIIFNIGIATSSLGAAYGIMYSNAWNLFGLADKRHTFFADNISRYNKHKAPFISVVIEGLIIAIYLFTFRGNLIPLQQICALGMITTYTICTVAFIKLMWQKNARVHIASLLALMSCGLLVYGFKDNVLAYGVMPSLYFIGIIIAGVVMYFASQRRSRHV